MKLTIENIQSYGSDLLFYVPSVHEITTLEKIHFKESIFSTLSECKTESYWSDDYILNPILRKMSQLTEKIIIDGVERIPIVELAKIAFPQLSMDWEFYEDIKKAINTFGVTFGYEDGFYTISSMKVPRQLQLFQWLYKHKFDLHGLIGAGLAVDASTLDINPYDN